jgi:hypothetical protein
MHHIGTGDGLGVAFGLSAIHMHFPDGRGFETIGTQKLSFLCSGVVEVAAWSDHKNVWPGLLSVSCGTTDDMKRKAQVPLLYTIPMAICSIHGKRTFSKILTCTMQYFGPNNSKLK